MTEQTQAINVRRIKLQPVEAQQNNTAEAIAERLNQRVFHVHLYTDGPHETLDPQEINQYISQTLGEKHFPIDFRGDFISYWLEKADENQKESFIKKMAEAKRWASTSIRYGAPNMPLSLEEKQELEREMLQTIHTGFIGKKLNEQRVQKFGRQVSVDDNDYYQADELKAAYQALIDPAEITPPGAESDVRIHLIITGRGVSSKELDGSIHCRIGSFSAGLGVISTTGLLDGPAGPAQYEELLLKYDQTSSDLGFHDPLVKMGKWEQYKKARDKLGMNKPLLALRVAFPEQMLLPDDPRMTGVAKGLCLQAIFFGTGVIQNPSCSHSTPSGPDMSKTCRFHDAHRQEELLNCQVHKPQFCPFHSRILELLEK